LRGSLERRIWEEGPAAGPWEGPLKAASWAYGMAVRARSWSLRRGVWKSRRLPVPVISVGNLTVGGTGKTPVVMLIAELLRDSGRRVAILSRGYGRRKGKGVRCVCDGKRVLADLEEAGDEPFMMAQRLPGVCVWVAPDRFRGGEAALRDSPLDVFILDDGFQHRRLHRDLDLVVVRGPRPFGNRRLLPSGPLREPPGALRRAHLVILVVQGDPGDKERSLKEVREIAGDLAVIAAHYRPRGLWEMPQGRPLPLDLLSDKQVALVCGIGRPEGFKATVASLGARVEALLSFPDHHWYTSWDMERLRRIRRGVEALVTTEKDWWKLQRAGAAEMDIWVLKVDLEVEQPEMLHGSLARFL
jgi:tetraacyldisaccharide 4'-kinase